MCGCRQEVGVVDVWVNVMCCCLYDSVTLDVFVPFVCLFVHKTAGRTESAQQISLEGH